MRAEDTAGQSVLPRTRKARALLAILALAAPRPVLRASVAKLLWSQREQEQARASLRQAVHELHERLAPLSTTFQADRNHLTLDTERIWLDVGAFNDPMVARANLVDAFQHRLLDDLHGLDPGFDHWLLHQTERLRKIARTVAESMLAEQPDCNGVLRVAEQLVAIDRSHEPAWRAVIEAYAEIGDRGAAVLAFEKCRAALAETELLPVWWTPS